jgi:hypothetical protein
MSLPLRSASPDLNANVANPAPTPRPYSFGVVHRSLRMPCDRPRRFGTVHVGVNLPFFQAGHAGSIPVTRSEETAWFDWCFRCRALRWRSSNPAPTPREVGRVRGNLRDPVPAPREGGPGSFGRSTEGASVVIVDINRSAAERVAADLPASKGRYRASKPPRWCGCRAAPHSSRRPITSRTPSTTSVGRTTR